MKKNSERSAAMRFTMKLSILLTPFIALLVVYFLNDPFMVLRNSFLTYHLPLRVLLLPGGGELR